VSGVRERDDIVDQGPWLTVDLSAMRANAEAYRARVGVALLPMVKANGYGLGAVAVARALESLDPWGFGVASLAEAAELREAGIRRPVVAFLPFLPNAAAGYRRLGVRPVIGSVAELVAWLAGGPDPFHLAIDTGMGRSGVSWRDDPSLGALGGLLAGAAGYEGAFTHFHSAADDEAATAAQWERFVGVVGRLGAPPRWVHAANSAGGRWGGRFAGTLARPGIFLYGGAAGPWAPSPVARLEALVDAVRPVAPGDTISYGATYRVADAADGLTLGIGYADGLIRALSNRGWVAVGDQRYRIAGRVTMDMTMVVVPRGAAAAGDRVTLFGGPIPLDEQAALAGTISYELLTAVGRRVRRRYLGDHR
jgi:alanine racemase